MRVRYEPSLVSFSYSDPWVGIEPKVMRAGGGYDAAQRRAAPRFAESSEKLRVPLTCAGCALRF